MTDDLIDRLHNPNFDDLQWPKGLFAECADRIEALEAALRGIAYMVPKTDSNGFWWHQKIARLALGEKEDGQSMG